MSIGERIREVRMRLGMTQEQFARGINCSTNVLSRVERGVTVPSEKMKNRIMANYGIRLEWLSEGNGEVGLEKTDSVSKESIASRIRLLRKENGLTQKEFGDAVGVSASTIQSIELGKRNASGNLMIAIADRFCCSHEWLLSGKERILSEDEMKKAEQIVSGFRALFSAEHNCDEEMLDILLKNPVMITHLDRLMNLLIKHKNE